MDNIRACIETLFQQINSAAIQSRLMNNEGDCDMLCVDEDMFCQKFMVENKCYTLDQVRELYHLVCTRWIEQPFIHIQQKEQNNNLFYILLHFSKEILAETDNKPVCKYNQLLRWRTLVYKLGEDLFTTSFLAFNDIKRRRKRDVFSWSPVILQDNPAIDYILRKGVTDLHFHLRGSSLNFELNWLSLMNNIANRRKDFAQLRKCLSHNVSTLDKEKWDSFYLMTVKACAIRYYLFLLLRNACAAHDFCPVLHELLNCDNDVMIQKMVQVGEGKDSQDKGSIQQYINAAKYLYGYKVNGAMQCVDYAIPMCNDMNSTERILSGERSLLYGMFHRIYSQGATHEEKVLFYIYLLQKGRMRKELVQLNELEGFGNFADYERRKELFIENRDLYQRLVPKLAVDMAFANGFLKYLECRITPKRTSKELLHTIRMLEWQITGKVPNRNNGLNDKEEQKYYYILHFIKRQDETECLLKNFNNLIHCRHYGLRRDIKQQGAATLEGLRKYQELRKRVIGIDAANTELYCRPEVFGPIYRYMKRFCNTDSFYRNGGYSLKFTYHVGEDFWDIVDGLRAIDEAILFLNLNSSDRLGHALALGTNVEEYYRFRNSRVVTTKQNLMDNAMWMLNKAKELNITVSTNVTFELQKIFNQFYDEVYLHNEMDQTQEYIDSEEKDCFGLLKQGKDVHLYYLSWLLRGDDPEYYKTIDPEKYIPNYTECTLWDITKLNLCDENIVRARKNRVALKLYRCYHYDADVRRIGNERYELKLSHDIIQLIAQIQRGMCNNIAAMHLGIEANITSNQFIGSMNKYIQHPIVRLYQLGLSIEDKNNECPQMSVSINTDDRGMFDTTIEEEYALLALALEKEMDRENNPRYQPRYIYEWLNNIRKMGFEQQFIKQDASKY